MICLLEPENGAWRWNGIGWETSGIQLSLAVFTPKPPRRKDSAKHKVALRVRVQERERVVESNDLMRVRHCLPA
jgi:hypothetical protein